MLYWPFVCATPTMHSPVYVNYLCCSWRQSATCNSPVMLCTSAWQKARWGGWVERRWMRRRWGRRLTPERTASPCCLNGHITDGEWKQVRGCPESDARPFRRPLDAEVRRGASAVADPSREGGIPLSETDRSPHSARRWQRLQPPRNSWETGCCRPSTATATWVYWRVERTIRWLQKDGLEGQDTAEGIRKEKETLWRVDVCLLISRLT